MTTIGRLPPVAEPGVVTPHRVAVLLYDGMSTFETGIVSDVFGLWGDGEGIGAGYRLLLCASDGPVRGIGGLTLHTPYTLDDFAEADTVITTGVSDVHAPVPASTVEALRRAHARGARVASICSGAFALAAAGLLDGRRATTHWRYAPLLASRYPLVQVEPDVLYVEEGRLLTSAGSAAGIDLCLHIVRVDHGSAVANAVARRMVAPPHRDGGQAQFVETAVPVDGGEGRVAQAMTYALAHLTEPLNVERLARRVGLSPRTFARHFRHATGTSPIRWLNTQRVRASLPMLEECDAPVEEIAAHVGMDVVTYRRHFRLETSTSPSSYRRTFRRREDGDAS